MLERRPAAVRFASDYRASLPLGADGIRAGAWLAAMSIRLERTNGAGRRDVATHAAIPRPLPGERGRRLARAADTPGIARQHRDRAAQASRRTRARGVDREDAARVGL